jgi:L-threonylcarbamoyladenylate synthase
MIRLYLDPNVPDPALIARAAEVIKAGGLVAMPTDTLYGLAANPFDEAAVRRVFLVKGRPEDSPLVLVAADLDQIRSQLGPMPAMARALAKRFWPGPLTLLVPATPVLPPDLTAGTGVVGVRVPAHAVSRTLCRASGTPLTATSANVTGQPASADPEMVAETLGAHIDVLLDAGTTSGGPASTVVDTTDEQPRLVRAGAVPWEQVLACLNER